MLQAILNFPNQLSGWEGPGVTLSLGYRLISLPTHSMGTLPVLAFALEAIDCAPPPLSSNSTGTQFPGIVTSPSGQMQLKDSLHSA